VLRELVRDPARRIALGERGARFARERHDLRVVGGRLLRIYREMLGAGSATPSSGAGEDRR
jgi:glycosyltransferase involved in cell wall biosynthesis